MRASPGAEKGFTMTEKTDGGTPLHAHGYVAAIKGVDGRCLGLSFDDGSHINRDDYESWQSFLADVALIVMTRIPRDTESEHAKRLIEEDSKRVGELLSQAVSYT